MGFRYRKSINLGGGFRVNLSTKGIGYSWGVKGYRVTKTADGRTRQTVSIPGTGISYVEEHGKKRQQSAGSQAPAQPVDPYAGYSNVQQVTSADANTLRSGVYEELFRQIKWAKTIRIIGVILTLLSSQVGMGFFYLCVAACVALFFLSRNYIEYEFDDVEQVKWEKLSAAWRAVASSQSLQEITVTAKARNTRTNAGIENSVDTVKMTAGGKLPWYLRTNIKPVVFKLQNCQFAVMPDRLLVFTKNKLGAVDYTEAKFNITAVGFLETGPIPRDSEVVKQVWAYANNDGSPDKRYANNRQYPVMKYGRVEIRTANGLNIQFMCSNEKAADTLYHAING